MSSLFKNRFDEKGHHSKTLSSSNDYYLEGWQEVPFTVREEAEQFVFRLKTESDVEDALIESLIEIQQAIVPNDPQYLSNNQWHLNNLGNQNADIDAEQAWGKTGILTSLTMM